LGIKKTKNESGKSQLNLEFIDESLWKDGRGKRLSGKAIMAKK
jgi:hypothetical protein